MINRRRPTDAATAAAAPTQTDCTEQRHVVAKTTNEEAKNCALSCRRRERGRGRSDATVMQGERNPPGYEALRISL